MHINGLVLGGVTIIVTTHFMEEAEFCETIGLVHRGQIIAEGSPKELKKRTATKELPAPTMEEAFVSLIKSNERHVV